MAPDGADLEPTSLDLASTRGSDTTAAMPVGTGRMVGGVSDGGFGTDEFADEVLSDDDAVDSDPTRGGDTTAAMPVDAGRVIVGVSDGGFGIADFADEVLSDDGVDFGSHLAWDGGDEVTAALPDGAHAVATTVAMTGAKRKRKQSRTAQDARKHQRRRPLAVHGSAPGTDTGSGVRQSDNA